MGEIAHARQMMDANDDGTISLEEFCNFMANAMEGMSEHEEIEELWEMFGGEETGKLTADQIHVVLTRLGLKFSVGDIRALLQEVDEDGNGHISKGEFEEMMEKYK
eukprot:NODE_7327_length_461_cov_31.507282_g6496_i0.p1 GENE.NODE_7327_length_461_cov_31.507282_g6496_i0~~NODE_7327_length_461_cov_31.507282_g6496_i0.p1  ORF type:complete len:114 (-),score=51.17 NODE_7327_length_461_cov_31.507282_g6496_i0:119-436(-)